MDELESIADDYQNGGTGRGETLKLKVIGLNEDKKRVKFVDKSNKGYSMSKQNVIKGFVLIQSNYFLILNYSSSRLSYHQLFLG